MIAQKIKQREKLPTVRFYELGPQQALFASKMCYQNRSVFKTFMPELEICMGRIFQSGPGPARSKEKNFGPGPARPERENEISARARPGPKGKLKFRPEPGPARPILFPISFKTAWFK